MELPLKPAGFPDGLLGCVLIVPEIGSLHLFLDVSDGVFQRRNVKGTSGVPTGGPLELQCRAPGGHRSMNFRPSGRECDHHKWGVKTVLSHLGEDSPGNFPE